MDFALSGGCRVSLSIVARSASPTVFNRATRAATFLKVAGVGFSPKASNMKAATMLRSMGFSAIVRSISSVFGAGGVGIFGISTRG